MIRILTIPHPTPPPLSMIINRSNSISRRESSGRSELGVGERRERGSSQEPFGWFGRTMLGFHPEEPAGDRIGSDRRRSTVGLLPIPPVTINVASQQASIMITRARVGLTVLETRVGRAEPRPFFVSLAWFKASLESVETPSITSLGERERDLSIDHQTPRRGPRL